MAATNEDSETSYISANYEARAFALGMTDHGADPAHAGNVWVPQVESQRSAMLGSSVESFVSGVNQIINDIASSSTTSRATGLEMTPAMSSRTPSSSVPVIPIPPTPNHRTMQALHLLRNLELRISQLQTQVFQNMPATPADIKSWNDQINQLHAHVSKVTGENNVVQDKRRNLIDQLVALRLEFPIMSSNIGDTEDSSPLEYNTGNLPLPIMFTVHLTNV